MSSLNFTAIDVETANSQRGSVCAVGIVQVRNGVISETFEWHVTPPTGIDSFHPRNIGIHGITPEMVKEAANTWADSLEAIGTLAEDYPLVAYNAAFDKSVIHESSRLSGLTPPTNDFHCALALSKRLLTLEKYQLPLVAAELGVDPFTHHDAGSDAAACAQIVLALSRRHGLQQISELWSPGLSTRNASTARPTVFSKGHTSSMAELPQPDSEADPSHPFYGRQVIMTGDLESFDRWEAMERIASCGGINGKGVTKKTAFLLVGDGQTHASIALENGTNKERKAAAYIAAGQDITVLTESEFLKVVGADASVVSLPDAMRRSTVVTTIGSTHSVPGEPSAPTPRPAADALASSSVGPMLDDPEGQYAYLQSETTSGQHVSTGNSTQRSVPSRGASPVMAEVLKAGARAGRRLFGTRGN